MPRHMPRGMFGTEAELCDALISVAREQYFVHSEVGGWDVLLVHRTTGEQVGIQAKLRPSVDVLAQALVHESLEGPDVHAVLVPFAASNFLRIARELRLATIQGGFVDSVRLLSVLQQAPRWKHRRRHWVPEVEVIAQAGTPSPKRMTKWKLAACKLCLLARAKGYVTAEQMRELGLHRAWWFEPKFGPVLKRRTVTVPGGWEIVRRGEYVLRDLNSPTNPDQRWPEIAQALQATVARKRGRLRVRVQQL